VSDVHKTRKIPAFWATARDAAVAQGYVFQWQSAGSSPPGRRASVSTAGARLSLVLKRERWPSRVSLGNGGPRRGVRRPPKGAIFGLPKPAVAHRSL